MKKKLSQLDLYSGIAILFVVIVHANCYYASYTLKVDSVNKANYFINLIDKIMHVAVAMFIFISGFKFGLDERIVDKKIFISKKIKKVFKPFFILSIFFVFFHRFGSLIKSILNDKSIDITMFISNLFKDVILFPIGYNYAYQLWYIPMYLAVVISYIFIIDIFSKSRKRLILFSVLSIFYVFIVNSNNFFVQYPYPLKFIYYFIFYELGIVFARKKEVTERKGIILLSYLILVILISFIKDEFLSNILNDLLLTPLSVIAWYYISFMLERIKTLNFLGENSFYIFLFHEPIVLFLVTKLFYELNMFNNYFFVICSVLISICLSIVIHLNIAKSRISSILY